MAQWVKDLSGLRIQWVKDPVAQVTAVVQVRFLTWELLQKKKPKKCSVVDTFLGALFGSIGRVGIFQASTQAFRLF